MFYNYFKTACRNLWRNKSQAIINIAGLVLGMVCCMFIFLWVKDEKSVDNFHQNEKNIYAVYQTITANGKTDGNYSAYYYNNSNTGGFLMEDIEKSVPEIKQSVYYAIGYELPWGHPETIQVGNKKMKLNGCRAGKDFFKVFSFPLLQGNAETALNQITSMAISKRMAEIFFGSAKNALGKTMRYENKLDFMVSAVFDNIPAQSSLQFDFLLNWEVQKTKLEFASSKIQSFVVLADGANAKTVENTINRVIAPRVSNTNGVKVQLGLQRFGDQYLHSTFVNGKPVTGRIEYVKLFSAIAIFILIIACINYMNLATARSVKRAKEIGVRKVVGSTRFYLICQFLCEALLIAFIAQLVAVLLISLLLPGFNQFTGKHISSPFFSFSFWVPVVTLAVITGLLAGSYPALYLSSLKPVRILKGAFRFTHGAVVFRKGLTVFQFVLSIVLIIATIVIFRQTNYVQKTNLGYDREDLVYVRIEGELSKPDKYRLFKEMAGKMPGIAAIDRSSETPHEMIFTVNDDQIMWEGKQKGEVVEVNPSSVGYDFVKLMKLQMVQGRDFSRDIATDSADAFIINETAARLMNMNDPIGKWVSAWKKKGHIVGVLKDFHTQSLHDPIKPLLLDVKEYEYFGVVLIRTKPGEIKQALASLANVYKQVNPDYPFAYQFVDEEYNNLYRSEIIMSKLSVLFATLAIVISCLGLLGLVMFSAEQRIKEIGIRKVLGASLVQIVELFSRDFVMLILIAYLIAAPLAWLATNKWLQGFAYRTSLSWWIFLVAGLSALLIAIATISFQAIKSARTNPVKNLRSE